MEIVLTFQILGPSFFPSSAQEFTFLLNSRFKKNIFVHVYESCYNLSPSGKFDAMGVAEGAVDPQLGRVKVMRLNVHSESDNWAILSEVSMHGWCHVHLSLLCSHLLTYLFVCCRLTLVSADTGLSSTDSPPD
jgi:hypothetical protein